MKRYSDNTSPCRWKRICPPADDSDSDSTSDSFDETHDIYRRLYTYGGPNCTQCGYPNLVCSCNVRHSLTPSTVLNLNSSPRRSMLLLSPSESAIRVERLTRADGGGSSSSSSNQAITASNSGNSSTNNDLHTTQENHNRTARVEISDDTNRDEDNVVTFRASTSVERFSLRDSLGSHLRFPCTMSRERSVLPGPEESRQYDGTSSAAASLLNKIRSEAKTPVASQVESPSRVANGNVSTSQLSINGELEELHARLLSLIECPVCMEPIVPPVHQCRRGHLLCGKCRSQLSQCPTCRDRMCEMRNWAVERVAELLKYPCRNAALGCTVTTLLSGKNSHESTCPFRHYNCPFRTCSWTGFQQEMLPHLASTHSLRFLEGARQQIDVELNSPTLFYTDWAISCFGRVFRFNVFQHIPNSMFYASAYLVAGGGGGPGNSESDYTYTVTVNGSLGRRVSYTRQTHAETTRTSSLCHSEDCFSIRCDKMEHFVGESGNLRLHVELEKLEIPAATVSDSHYPTN